MAHSQRMNHPVLGQWGRNIEAVRKRLRLSQAQLGAMLDPPVSQPTVARWENGKAEPRLDHKIQLCRVLRTEWRLLFPEPVVAA